MGWTGVVTNAGKEMLAQYIASGKNILIDEVQAGSGTVNTLNMYSAIRLRTVRDSGRVVSTSKISGGVMMRLEVGACATPYTLKEIGVFAFDSNHSSSSRTMMMLIQNTDGVSIPDAEQFPDFVFDLTVTLPVSNTANITVNIDRDTVVSSGVFADKVTELEEDISALETDVSALETDVSALESDLAQPYSNTSTYKVGEYVIQNHRLYKCKTAVTRAESFAATKWEAVKMGTEISDFQLYVDSSGYICMR